MGASRGPRPAGARTREAILVAAGEVFATEGYERGSLRGVARKAGVDPALVRHYFDSKVALFVESMRPPIDLTTQADRIAAGDADKVGERVIAFFIATWSHPVQGDRVVAMLRAALDHPEVAELVRKAIVENVIEEVARCVGATDPRAAAVSAASQVIGLTLLRHAARLEPLASMSPEELVRRFAPVITYHLTGTFPQPHNSSHGE